MLENQKPLCLFSQYFLFFLLVALPFGCRKEPAPEQKLADQTLQLAKLALAQGNYHESRSHLLSALILDERLGRISQVAEEQRMLGDSYAAAASYDTALSFYRRALERQKSLGDRNAARVLMLGIASLHRWMGEERTAYSIYSDALRVANVLRDDAGSKEIQWAMLGTCRELGNGEEEARILSDLHNTYSAAGDVGKQAALSYEAGLSSLNGRENENALEHFLRALTFAEQARDSVRAVLALSRLAMTYAEAGKTAEAFQAYTDGLKRSDLTQGAAKVRVEMLTQVGNLYLRKNQYGEARRFYRAALTSAISMQDRLAEGYLFIQVGHCEIRESKDAGIKDYQLALESFNGLGYPPGSAYALVSLALAAQRANRLPDALSYFKAALEQMDAAVWLPPRDDLFHECEQAFYESNQTSPYDGIIDLLLQLGRFDEAFWYVERKQGRALFDILASLDLRTRDEKVNGFLRQFQHARALRIGAERQLAQTLAENAQARELISDIHIQLDRTAREMQEASERIVEMNRALRQAVSISNFGLEEVQKLLPPGTALIEHVAGRRSVFTLMVTNGKMMTGVAAMEKEKALAMTREFSDLLLQRQLFADSSAGRVSALDRRREELGAALYGALVRPLEGNLPTIKKLIVVPQPEWGTLPLHALRKSPSRPYLGEQCLVTYLPSSLALQLPQFLGGEERRAHTAQMGSARDIVGLGHAGQTTWDVEYELKDIRAFYKDARLYFNQQANLATLQQEHGDVLHLAVEVHFDEHRPDNSSLVLSDGRSGTTQVPWGQLGALPPFPILIVSDLSGRRPSMLSAEAYLFLLTGTRTVVLNAYAPTRKAKKFFGEQFYTALLGGSTAEEGYRQAQLEMIRNSDYTSPHVWAPFFLWGR